MKLHTKNILSLFGFDGAVRLLGFISTTYIARTLGGTGFGLINLGLAVCSYGVIIVSPGVHIIATRMISQETYDDESIVRQVTRIRSALALGTFTIMALLVAMFIRDAVTRWITIVYCLSLVPYAMTIDWYFQGKRRLTEIGVARSLGLILFIILLYFFVHAEGDIRLVPFAYVLNLFCVAFLLFWLFWKSMGKESVNKNVPPQIFDWKRLIRQSIPVGAANFLGQAVLNFPAILLGLFATTLDIGYFSAASKLIFFLLAIDRAIYSIFYPVVAKTAAVAPSELGGQVSRVLRYLSIVALPIFVGGIVLAKPLMLLTFGDEYLASVSLMQVLLFYFIFTVFNSIFAYAVIAAGREDRYSKIIATCSVVLLIALLPLTYIWGAFGASFGLAAGELLMMVLMYRECRTLINSPFSIDIWRPLASSLIMGVLLLEFAPANFGMSVPFGMILYTISLLALRGLTREDLVYLKERLI